MQLSSIELRTLVAAQIASGLVSNVAPDSPQARIDEVVQLAVRIAKTCRMPRSNRCTRRKRRPESAQTASP